MKRRENSIFNIVSLSFCIYLLLRSWLFTFKKDLIRKNNSFLQFANERKIYRIHKNVQ